MKLGRSNEGTRLRVFENRVLRGIFGSKRDEVPGERRILHNEELNELHPPLNVVCVIKLRRMRRDEHVALWGEDR